MWRLAREAGNIGASGRKAIGSRLELVGSMQLVAYLLDK